MKEGKDDQLIFAAALLKRSAPREWQQFIGALARHALIMSDDLVRCTPEVVLVAQGRAKHAHELGELLNACEDLANKLEIKYKS